VSVLPRFIAARTAPPAGKIRIRSWRTPPRSRTALQMRLGVGDYCDRSKGSECPEGTQCMDDIRWGSTWPDGVCCEPGKIACGGRCVEQCILPMVPDRVNCSGCHCGPNPGCPAGMKWNSETCKCECLPIPCVGGVITPPSCQCKCPAGQIYCNGLCIDPLTDPTFCGGCPGDTCNPFNQKCCKGTCTTLCTDANCRDFGDQMPVGFKCCPGQPPAVMNCTPTRLGTSANCKGCGDSCIGGEQCINGACACPPGRDPCPSVFVRCCSLGQTCCDGSCVNTNTNKKHCGGCNKPCDRNELCQNGKCICPPGSIVCHGRCCAPPFLACPLQVTNPTAEWHCCRGTEPVIECPPLQGTSFWPNGYCCPIGSRPHRCCPTPGGCCLV
jgi:hypothetical protein